MKIQKRRFHEFLIIAVLLPGVPVILGSCGDGGGGSSFDLKFSYDSPTSMATGDLDGDGLLDLVVCVRRVRRSSPIQGTADVILQSGQEPGEFSFAASFPVGRDPRQVVIGDVDGDGVPDLVVANEGSDSISVLRGEPNGGFLPAIEFDSGALPRSVAIKDMDADGLPDLVVTSPESGTSVFFQEPGEPLGFEMTTLASHEESKPRPRWLDDS